MTPAEFGEVHLSFARNVPMDSLDPDQLMRSRNGNIREPLYVICRSGNRAGKACEKLVADGYDNVVTVEGGTQAGSTLGSPWSVGKRPSRSNGRCGLPLVRWCSWVCVSAGSCIRLLRPWPRSLGPDWFQPATNRVQPVTELIVIAVIVAVWLALNLWILPRLGVPT